MPSGKIDKVKIIRRTSRANAGPHGKARFHKDKRSKRQRKPSTADYLSELEEEESMGFRESLESEVCNICGKCFKTIRTNPICIDCEWKEDMRDELKVGVSDIVTAFDNVTIGTKVTDPSKFFEALEHAILDHKFHEDRVPGQGFLTLNQPERYLSAGVGKRTENPDDYVVRFYRGQVHLYLDRQFASKIEGGAAVVYTAEAYLADPDVNEEEVQRIKDYGFTHMLVAVLGFAGPKAPLSPYRFVHNLAGGNKEALKWTADEIRDKAREIMDYWSSETGDGWCTVAD